MVNGGMIVVVEKLRRAAPCGLFCAWEILLQRIVDKEIAAF
jgi:hypothetical protein